MTKPERIFNCDSGWSIDLDMVTYIGIPEITNTKVTLKIGMDSNVSKGNKDLFVVHEEDFSNIAAEIGTLNNVRLLEEHIGESLSKEAEEVINWYWKGNLPEKDREKIMESSDTISMQYIEAEFKPFHTQLKTSWNQWVNYKESLRG